MMRITDDPVSVDAVRRSQRMEWRERLVRFLIPRLKGTVEEQETVMDMVLLSISEAHNEGVEDCVFVVSKLVETASGDRQFVLKTVRHALAELHRLNAQDAETQPGDRA
jgi:hypothetical protein